jgi:2-keto-4-pentenoate hydratase/2-oxohepta-3-ene-1,7-dioic acid hydratase in catechol pathway
MTSTAAHHIARYALDGAIHYGRREHDHWIRWSDAPWRNGRERAERDPVARVTLLTPCEPTKIVCIGLNYRAHVAESQSVLPGAEPPKEPLVFLKPPSAALAHGQAIRYPRGVTRLDPEAEMAVVIGARVRHASLEQAMSAVAGVTCFNDVSARNYQKTDGQWARAKGFDTFAPFGPWIATGLDPGALTVECRVNGAVRQRGHTRDLLFPVAELIRHVSGIMTLEPGDVISTGTPSGVGNITPGDVVQIEIEGIGVLENPVIARP